MSTEQTAQQAAEKAISAILKEFEIRTGAEVLSVNLVDVEVTSMNDTRERFKRTVQIAVRHRPDVDWA